MHIIWRPILNINFVENIEKFTWVKGPTVTLMLIWQWVDNLNLSYAFKIKQIFNFYIHPICLIQSTVGCNKKTNCYNIFNTNKIIIQTFVINHNIHMYTLVYILKQIKPWIKWKKKNV